MADKPQAPKGDANNKIKEEVAVADPQAKPNFFYKNKLFVYFVFANIIVLITFFILLKSGPKVKTYAELEQDRLGNGAETSHAKPEHTGEATAEDLAPENKEQDQKIEMIALEPFLINISAMDNGEVAYGKQILHIKIEMLPSSYEVMQEVDKIMPKVRDEIHLLFSGKTNTDISSDEGQNQLRADIAKRLNTFLRKGEIKKVYFTEYVFK